MYKIRASSISTLLEGCGKVANKFEWKDLEKMTESHIKLAIQVYNKNNGFESADIDTLDMSAGTEQEPQAIMMYDEFLSTNYFKSYNDCRTEKGNKPFEVENDWITGTRDFGSKEKTIDCKISTDKNVFDLKRFSSPEINYTIQLNAYGWLYNTNDLELFNALMPPTEQQINKFFSNKNYNCKLTFEQEVEYREKILRCYDYDFLPLRKRVIIKKVENINNFESIVKSRVEVLNEWIEKNLKRTI